MQRSPERAFALKVVIAVAIVAAVLGLFALIGAAIHVLLLTFLSILLAILWRAPADWLHAKTRMPEGVALLLVFGVFAAAGTLLWRVSAPQVTEQVEMLRSGIPEAIDRGRAWLGSTPLGTQVLESIPEWGELGGLDLGLLTRATGVASATLGGLVSAIIVLFVTLYLAVNPRLYVDGALRLVPAPRRERGAEVMGALGYTLRWWLIASLIKMAAVGGMTYAGLRALDMPLAPILAVIAFVLDFVPYFGPIVAAVPAVLLAFVEGPEQVLWVAGLYFVVQQIESFLISPLLFQKTVYLPPVITVLAQVVLGAIAGSLGVILATPLTAVAIVLVKTIYVEEILGDDLRVPGDPVESKLVDEERTGEREAPPGAEPQPV